MIKQSSAGVVVYRVGDDGKHVYLLLQYPRGTWDFPKGKLKDGERWKDGAIREAREETGIDLAIDPDFEHSYSYSFNDFRGNRVEKTVVFFLGKAKPSDNIMLSQEHVDYLWLTYDQARMQLPFENVKHLLDQAENFLQRKLYS